MSDTTPAEDLVTEEMIEVAWRTYWDWSGPRLPIAASAMLRVLRAVAPLIAARRAGRLITLDHEIFVNGLRIDAGEYLLTRIGPPSPAEPEF